MGGIFNPDHPDWPQRCQESWGESFERWAGEGEPKTLSPDLMKAVAHTLQSNLAYIRELEEAVKEKAPGD